MKLVRKSLNKWIQAAIMLVVGILVIVAGSQMGKGSNPSDALNAISLVLGDWFNWDYRWYLCCRG